MLPGSDLAKLANLCISIGNEITDDTGFVSINGLLKRFNAQLAVRPLLVEGMLGSTSSANGSSWTVLVDSETYPCSQDEIDREAKGKTLPPRMRNTIAHELVHSLAFRTSEFGLSLKSKLDAGKNLQEFVKEIEHETERFSPLLLWSEKSLRQLLLNRSESLGLSEFVDVLKSQGISRYVLVNRLTLIRQSSLGMELLYSSGLRNIAVGFGIWSGNGALIKGWPIFWNFDNGITPSFLLDLPDHQIVAANSLIDDQTTILNGGNKYSTELVVDAGTKLVRKAKKMKVQLEIEQGPWKKGTEFLFSVRGLGTI
jgi:hypothetical protein